MACETPVGGNCPRPGDSDNILLRKILSSLNAVGEEPPGTPAGLIEVINSLVMTDDESSYWIRQAALLDPRAFEFVEGTIITVPPDVMWMGMAWWGQLDSGGNFSQFQRVADGSSVNLPAGTVFTPAFAFSYVYLCKPELVTSVDSRYSTGTAAKNLYYTRLQRLFSLPLSNLTAVVPNTTPFGGNVTVAFPADFINGLLVETSSFDVSWTGLVSSGAGGSLNLDPELSDDHQSRFTRVGRLPFTRSQFPSIRSRAASISGTAGTMLAGSGNIFYHKLPVDW